MAVSFKEEFKDVLEPERKITSFGISPLNNLQELRFYAGGHKFSQLCGFKFKSKFDSPVAKEDPYFQVSFVCKLRSKIWREQNTNTSRWYVFVRTSPVQVRVLSKKTLLEEYGFDLDKFFDSDLFKKFVPQFQSAVKNGVEKIIPEFIDRELVAKGGEEKNKVEIDLAKNYQRAISDSIPYIAKTYVEDKNYTLNDLDFKWK